MQTRHIFKQVISFLLCFSFILSFGICGVYASDGDDEDPAVITIASDKLEYSGTVVADGSSQGMNFTQLIEKTSYTKNGIKFTGFKMPKYFYDGGNSLTIHFSAYNPVTIRADHEYNIDFHFLQSYSMKTDISVSVYIYNSNGTVYKNKQIYTEELPHSLSPRDLNFNFSLPKSDLPDGYYCRFIVSISQHTSGTVSSTVTNTFYLSDITLTDLDNNVGWFQKIINAIKSIPENIKNFFTNLGESIGNFFTELWSKLKTQFENIGKWFSELGDKIGQFFEDLYNDIIEGLKSLFIPKNGFFEEKKKELEAFLEDHFGILWTAPNIIISTIRQLLTISPKEPTITMPSIQFHWQGKLVTLSDPMTVHFNDYIGQGTSLHTFYQFYRTFITIVLIFLFLRYCINKYHYIFGKDGEAVEQ